MTSSPNTADDTGPADPRRSPFDTSFRIILALALMAAAGVAWQHGPMRVVEIAGHYLGLLALLGPKILCGFFIAAAVPILLPPEQLTRWVGQDSGTRGLLVAALAGALVPGGPMMIFPLAASFRLAGASTATMITFVTAWSLYGINRTVIWEMSFLHVNFVLLRVAISLPLPLLAGWLAGKVIK